MNENEIQMAQARVGKAAVLSKGLLRGTVTVKAAKWAYGRTMYQVVNERGESEWVNAASLLFSDDDNNKQ